ncbi:MAG: chemotaxis protein CheW [Candidatus Hodarchaeales archaeon]
MSQILSTSNFEDQYVTFKLGTDLVAVKLTEIETIKLVDSIIPIPRAPNHVVGVANIEDSIVPLIDLDVLLSLRKKEIHASSIIIIVSIDKARFGLYTHDLPRVTTLENIESKDLTSSIIPSEWVVGYSNNGDLNILVLNPERFWIGLGSSELAGPSISQEEVTFLPTEKQTELESVKVEEASIKEVKDKKPKKSKKSKKNGKKKRSKTEKSEKVDEEELLPSPEGNEKEEKPTESDKEDIIDATE